MDDSTRAGAEGAPRAEAPQPSVEDELRAAYEELEAARRKLEELKAKYPPSAAEGAGPGAASAQRQACQQAGGAWQAAGAQQQYGQQHGAQQNASQAGGAWQAAGAQQQYGQQQYGQPYGQQQHQYAQQQQQQQYGQQYSPYQAYQQPCYSAQVVRTKDHVAAGLLAIFLGSFGVHKFYLGYNSAGFVMLAVTIVGSLLTLGIAAGVMGVIGFVEGIIYLVKSQTDFEQLYVQGKREWF